MLAHLTSLARLISEARDLDDVLGPLLRFLSAELHLSRVALSLCDADSRTVTIEAAHGLTPAEVRRGRYAFGEGIIGRVAASGEAMAVPSVALDSRFVDKTGALRTAADRAFVCTPIRARGRVVGTLSAYRLAGDGPALHRSQQMLEVVSAMLAEVVARHQIEREPFLEAADRFRPADLIGRSKPMEQVYDLIEQVASSPTTVLLLGESGTGKEMVATALHRNSPRARRPFVRVNCAALAESVIESELFGHEAGAFTGAIQQRKGRFELAQGGTLFLDEIGDLSPQTQIKLLRVLQQREFERVGGTRTLSVDVRVIAATSRDLETMITTGAFRADLYYRLNIFPIRLPPLRERRSDVLLLADHFVETFSKAHGKGIHRIATSAIDMLMAYHWPGNVRELENCIERAVLLARGDALLGHHLPPTLQTPSGAAPQEGLKAQLEVYERELVLDALKANHGNMAAAARDLQVTERIMGLRVGRFGIDPARFRPTKM